MHGRQGVDGTHVTMHSRVLLNVLAGFSTGEVQPDSEVEQSVISCSKHRFTHSYDARPVTAPLFSDMQLHSWRCRCLRSCLPHQRKQSCTSLSSMSQSSVITYACACIGSILSLFT